MKRVAVLFSRLSGYMSACFQALKKKHNLELLIIRIPPASNAPFNQNLFTHFDKIYDRTQLKTTEIKEIVQNFNPDAIYVSGWFDRGYLQVARFMRKKGTFVVAGLDRQWNGTLRQNIARLISPFYLHSAYDAMWVAGERQRQYANRLGYRGSDCWSGVYACDWKQFSHIYIQHESKIARNKSFLFVGRFIPEKGIDVLLKAYRRYRDIAEYPWELVCAGKGKLEPLIDREPGVINRGFVQPADLPYLMGNSGVFILPSRHEPWGIVLQEAAATGLPLLCSDACGASVHLLQDGYNGYIFETENVNQLADYMLHLSHIPPEQRKEMGQRSFDLSRQFTPERWADTFMMKMSLFK